MSSWARAARAEPTIVTAAMTARTTIAAREASKSGRSRATKYTPAATMVAAWISAETGVGPAIASGSQVCSGNCADLPATPARSSSAITVGWPTDPPATAPRISVMRKEPASVASASRPIRKGTSPSLVTRKALREAARASGVSQ